MKMIPAPSIRGTNVENMLVPACWFAKPGLALDAAPDIRSWKLGRDGDAPMYPESGTQGVKNMMGGADNGLSLLKKIEAALGPGVLTDDETAQLRAKLASEGTDEQIESGPLDAPKPSPTAIPPVEATDDIREFLKGKGLDDSDLERVLGPREQLGPPDHDQGRDQYPLPKPATEGGGGGRTAMSMDAEILRAGDRVLPQRGDRFFSIGASGREEPPASSMAAEAELHKMFPGIEKIGYA